MNRERAETRPYFSRLRERGHINDFRDLAHHATQEEGGLERHIGRERRGEVLRQRERIQRGIDGPQPMSNPLQKPGGRESL